MRDFIFHMVVHKFWLMVYLIRFAAVLLWRGIVHDLSKFREPERSKFIESMGKLKASTYGTDEYKQLLDDLGPALDSHYKNNRHHPEHFKYKCMEMDMYDVLEMIFDWKAACKKHKDGDINKSMDINEERYNIANGLMFVIRNTFTPGWRDE